MEKELGGRVEEEMGEEDEKNGGEVGDRLKRRGGKGRRRIQVHKATNVILTVL